MLSQGLGELFISPSGHGEAVDPTVTHSDSKHDRVSGGGNQSILSVQDKTRADQNYPTTGKDMRHIAILVFNTW